MTRPQVALALRAGGVTVLFAVLLALLWFVLYGLPRPEQEFLALAIWTPLLGIFTVFWTLILAGCLERGRRFLAALVLGAAGGLVWFVAATIPRGLWLAWVDLPVYVIWPLSAALGVAAVAPRRGQGVQDGREAWRPAVVGMTGIATLTVALKASPWWGPESELAVRALGAVIARPQPTVTTGDTSSPRPYPGAGGAPLIAPCREPAPRPLPLDPIVVDSMSIPRFMGRFSDRREQEVGGARHVYGRTLGLWSVEGSLTGLLESRAGPAAGPVHRAILERARFEEPTGALSFDAYFEDGFVTRFRGVLARGSVDGVLETVDGECLTRVLSTDTVTLKRDPGHMPPAAGRSFRDVMAEFVASGAYRRERRSNDGVNRGRSVSVDDGRWNDPMTSAMYFAARFSSRAEATAALRPGGIATPRAQSVFLRDILHAVRIDGTGRAEWTVLGPTEILVAYRTELEARERARTFSDLRTRIVPVVGRR
ncbi:MAG: hypothetical protein R3195_06555 [Gemmatimonadota bacterium]|nr:hypothetical protein [Gemmatimonadota bacterium]